MNRTYCTIVMVFIMTYMAVPLAYAQPVSMDEAYTVAGNWIATVIDKKGDWGGSDTATIQEIVAFKRDDKTIGYFCKVAPHGFILVSMRRELAPIKAYSARSDLDPNADEGLPDLLKRKMEGILNRFTQAISAAEPGEQGEPQALPADVEIDYRQAWDALERDPQRFMDESQRVQAPAATIPSEEGIQPEADIPGVRANYQEGQVLLTSDWHQGDPYNRDVPAPPSGDDCASAHCAVGCVATAGAQLMHYWKWPPYGEGSPYNDTYDWPNMPDSITAASPSAQINAIAELSREVGVAVGMDYCSGTGCASNAGTWEMEAVYQDHYRFSNVYKRDRSDYTATGWFDMMKDEFNWNRPVQYKVIGHSIVGDGWQEIGNPVVRQYHMNYGWSGTGDDAWYTLDALLLGDPDEEYLLENIRPGTYLMDLSNTYTRQSFPYRYFYRDTWGSGGTFEGGQRLQFLPGVFVYGTGSTAAPVTFEGSATYDTYLFSGGDLNRGIRIRSNANAAIKMTNNGGIKFD